MASQHPHRQNPFRVWRRITEGLELNQLWSQFHADARASYHLYSREVDFDRPQGVRKGQHFFSVVNSRFFRVHSRLSARLEQPQLLLELAEGPDVRQRKGEEVLVLVAHRAESEAAVFEAGAPAVAGVRRLAGRVTYEMQGGGEANTPRRADDAVTGAAVTD